MLHISGRWLCTLAALAGTTALLSPGVARANLVTNGIFAGTPGQIEFNGSLPGWKGLGTEGPFGNPNRVPVFLFPASGGTQTGDVFFGNVSFFGNPMSPSGNNFVAADGDPVFAGGIQQTVNGLTAGVDYTLTFNWAGAQQTGFSGPTTERWDVTFGGSTQSTATVNTPSQSFVGWQSATMTFTATSASQLLRFAAVGSPSGQPPWLLLDNVQLNSSLAAVPEPSTLAMVALGLGGLVGAAKTARRRSRQAGA